MTVAIALVGSDQASKPIADVTRSVQGLEKQAEHTGGVLGGLTSALGKVGLAGLGLKTAFDAMSGAVGLLTGPIQAASDLSESMNKVDVVFGDSARVVQDFARTAAQSLGQSQAQALEAAGGFGNLFVSMGLGQGAAARLSTNIVTLGSDLASFNNIKPEEALEKLRAGLVGEAEPLRTLGVNLNEAAVQDEALRLGLGKSKDTLTEAAKVQARYSLILQQTKTAQGDFARTSTGMANATRIISASLADLQTEIGHRLLPVVAPLISQFALLLPRAMDALKPFLDRAGAAFKSVADVIGAFVDNLRKKGLVAALGDLGREVGPALMAGLRAVQDFAGSVVGWLRQQIGSIDWSAVWSAAVNVGRGLVASLGQITGDVVAWLKGQWAAIDWGAVWSSATGVAASLATGLGQIGSTVTEWVKAQWAQIDWAAIWQAIQGHAAALAANLKPVTQQLQDWLTVSAADVDWHQVWRDARTGDRASNTVESLFQHQDSQPAARAIGHWLGDAALDGIDLVVTLLRRDGSSKLGYGFVAAIENGVKFAGPGMRLSMRYFGVDVAVALVEGIVEAITQRLGPAIQQAVSDAMRRLTPPMPSFVPPGVAPPTPPPPPPAEGPTGPIGNYQHGGVFRVGGTGGIDSRMVSFRATPGEVVAVGHARSGGGGGPVALTVNQTFHVANRSDADYLGAILPAALARALEKARSQQGQPQATGLVRWG